MRSMDTAPRDGTRVMVKVILVAFAGYGKNHPVYGSYRPVGSAWQECWFDGEKWQPWLGSIRSTSTAAVPDNEHWVMGWMPVSTLEPSGEEGTK